jgi:hypothetical protein
MYASLLMTSSALYLDVFERPVQDGPLIHLLVFGSGSGDGFTFNPLKGGGDYGF